MTPSSITFDIGDNVHGQPITLVRGKTTGGAWHWTIYRGQADQRDDSSSVSGLTPELLRAMADAADKFHF